MAVNLFSQASQHRPVPKISSYRNAPSCPSLFAFEFMQLTFDLSERRPHFHSIEGMTFFTASLIHFCHTPSHPAEPASLSEVFSLRVCLCSPLHVFCSLRPVSSALRVSVPPAATATHAHPIPPAGRSGEFSSV